MLFSAVPKRRQERVHDCELPNAKLENANPGNKYFKSKCAVLHCDDSNCRRAGRANDRIHGHFSLFGQSGDCVKGRRRKNCQLRLTVTPVCLVGLLALFVLAITALKET
jgi:hypothetical protein